MKMYHIIPALLSVQSGSDRTLKLIYRNHTRTEYIDKLKSIRDICPEIHSLVKMKKILIII